MLLAQGLRKPAATPAPLLRRTSSSAVAAPAETAASARRSRRPHVGTTLPVSLTEVEQQRCPRRLGACKDPDPAPSASARGMCGSAPAVREAAADYWTPRRAVGPRAIVRSAATGRALCHGSSRHDGRGRTTASPGGRGHADRPAPGSMQTSYESLPPRSPGCFIRDRAAIAALASRSPFAAGPPRPETEEFLDCAVARSGGSSFDQNLLLARRRGDAGWGHAPALLWTRYFATKMEELSRVDGFACWLRIALLRAVWLACGCVAGLVTNLRLAGVKG